MSIQDVIAMRVQEGRLFCIEPTIDDDPVERHMFVSEEIFQLLEGPSKGVAMKRRRGFLRDDLERFIKGDSIRVCLTPFEARWAYMARLDKPSDEVWDIRSRDPSPGLRVLGRFAMKNVFIALLCAPRSVPVDWLLRDPLNDRVSTEWRTAIRECKVLWQQLFHPYTPHSGSTIDDYVSEGTIPE